MGRFRGVQRDAGWLRTRLSRCWWVASSTMFEHTLAEGAKGMVVTHLMVSINAKRRERDVEVNVKEDTKTTDRIETWNKINLTR